MDYWSNTKNIKGFTLVEVLLSISLLLVLGTLSVPVYFSYLVKNDMDSAVTYTAKALKNAQAFSRASTNDSIWGVRVASNLVTIFQGNSFAGRTVEFDITYPIASTVTPSGISELTFSKVTGEASTTGNIVFTSSDNEVKIIAINIKGNLNYS